LSGYTPVFDSVFHGTLCGRWPTLPVWLTILPMADKHGHIDMTYQAMTALTGWPIELLKQAIAELMELDPESRSESEDGRRLVLIDPDNRKWGWRVVNHEKYREKARKSAYDADRVASGKNKERMQGRTRDDPRSPAPIRSQTQTQTQTEEKKDPPAPKGGGVVQGLDQQAWDSWIEYRQGIKKPLKPVSIPAAQAAMAALGEMQMAAVEHTKGNGWTGLRAPEKSRIKLRGVVV